MSGCINTQHKEQQEQEDQEQEHQQDQTLIIPNYPQPFQGPNFPLLPGPHMHYQESTDPFLPLSGGGGGGRSGLVFPPHEITPILPWGPLQPSHHTFNHFPSNPDPFLSSSYATLFGRRGSAPPQHHQHLQFSAYDVGAPSSSSVDPLRILSEALGQPGGAPFGLQMQAELNRMTAQEIMDAKALAASKSHSEAERRRRERINNHLAKLRSLLPSTTKTDKASLLAEVIQHVKELKRQTTVVMETTSVPTESDELTVDPAAEVDSDGRVVVKASLCCDDRNDLLPDLIKALKALHLRTLKAEITTLGGRVKNVLFVTGEDGSGGGEDGGGESSGGGGDQWSISSIQEALRAVMEKSGGGSSGGGREDSATGNAKRQRTNSNANIIT